MSERLSASEPASVQWLPKRRSIDIDGMLASASRALVNAEMLWREMRADEERAGQSVTESRSLHGLGAAQDWQGHGLLEVSHRCRPERLVGWMWMRFAKYSEKLEKLALALGHPCTLLRLGYCLLEASRKHDDAESMGAALCMLAIGLAGVVGQAECDVCFRMAVPGLRRCGLHSRAKLNLRGSSSSARPATAARRAKRIRENWQAMAATHRTNSSDGFRSTQVLTDVLRPCLGKSRWQEVINSAVVASPEVMRRLPDDYLSMEWRQQLSWLRGALDMEEFAASAWPAKIRAAELWFVQESAHTVRSGMTPLNTLRIETARRLISAGNRHAEAAANLGLSRSHLSHLLRRGQPARGS